MLETRSARRPLVARIMGILGAFSPSHPHLSLSDLSRHTGLPIATTHRLAAQLVSEGVLGRTTDGRYSIGIRLWEIGLAEPRGLTLRTAAHPLLLRLHDRTGATIVLSVLDGDESVVIEHLPSHLNGHGGPQEVVRRALARSTPAGRVLIAYAADPEDLARPEQRALAEIRRTGIAIDDGLHRHTPFSIAVPVGDAHGVIAALAAEGCTSTQDPRAITDDVRSVAAAISRALPALGRAGLNGGTPAVTNGYPPGGNGHYPASRTT